MGIIKDKLCVCNNCDAIMIDLNPGEQPELEIDSKKLTEMENIQQEDEETGHMIENYWGCPNCKTDGYLSDLFELGSRTF